MDGGSPEEREHGYSSSTRPRRGDEVSNEHEGGMQDESGWMALTLAAYWNRLECVKPLAEKEKDMKAMHKWYEYPLGITALDIVNERGHTAIASILSG